MNRTERIYKIQSLLTTRKAVPITDFLKALEVSRATFRRDLEYLRDRLNAPIVWDRDCDGYRLESDGKEEAVNSLPGLWLSDREILSLLTITQLLSTFEPNSIVSNQIAPIKKRLQKMLESGCVAADELSARVRVLPLARRPVNEEIFSAVADALLMRQRLEIGHLNKGTNKETTRQVSPQQLIYYRDNWYLDAFCHDKDDLRSFALDGINEAKKLESAAVSLPQAVLKETFEDTYGIFVGKRKKIAKLRFTPFRARWVSKEIWHPDQKASFDADGNYLLEIPYGDERELILDILRQGAECEVLAPEPLRASVVQRLHEALKAYKIK
jgi:predicted DNA-binding transcriptional regulator YafY